MKIPFIGEERLVAEYRRVVPLLTEEEVQLSDTLAFGNSGNAGKSDV